MLIFFGVLIPYKGNEFGHCKMDATLQHLFAICQHMRCCLRRIFHVHIVCHCKLRFIFIVSINSTVPNVAPLLFFSF